MKLTPIMKLIGKLTVSLIMKLTLLLFELFCIPIIRSKNKEKLNVNTNNSFFKGNNIF